MNGDTDRPAKLGPTIRMAKYWPNGTDPKGLDHYTDLEDLVADTDREAD